MTKRVLAVVLVLVSSSLLAAPARVADILKDLRAHGYVSPTAAAARLKAAQDAGDADAPLEQRRRYNAALISLALPERNSGLLEQALGPLQQMAEKEGCRACRASLLIGEAAKAVFAQDIKSAHADIRKAEALIPSGDPTMQLQLARVQISLERAQGTPNVAFRTAIRALDIAEQSGNAAAHVGMLVELSAINASLGYLDRAADAAAAAIKQAQAIGYRAALGPARINQGYVYALRNNRQEQRQALEQALAVSDTVPGLAHTAIVARANLADYYLNMGDYADTLRYAGEAAKLAHANGDLVGEALGLANVGIAKARIGQFEDAEQLMRESMALAQKAGRWRMVIGTNRELVDMLASAGEYREALQAMRAVNSVRDKITAQERDSAVLELQAKYDDERKNREIERLSADAKLKAAEADVTRWQKRLWTVLAVIAFLAVLQMVRRLRRVRHANQQLTRDMASLTQRSAIDELTGVFNRRHFAKLMEPYAPGSDASVGLVIFDIDHFKRINDEFGHNVGDLVLVEIARRVQDIARIDDRVVRWGGEEFVLVLPNATFDSLPSMARRLLDAVGAQPVQVGNKTVIVTISAGCVTHPLSPDSTWEQALQLADVAMYRAKQTGRNRAICARGIGTPLPHEDLDGTLGGAIRSDAIDLQSVDGPPLAPSRHVSGIS